MEKRRTKLKLKAAVPALTIMIMVLSVFCFAGTQEAFAGSARVSLGGGGTVEKGSNVSVTLKYSGATFGSATARVTYDSNILEYLSCSGAEANGGGGNVIVTMANGSGTASLACTIKFKAKKAGSTSVKASTTDVYNIDLEELSAGSASTSVTVNNAAEKASDNADLSAMQVSSGTLSPAFSPSVTSYRVNVNNSVTVCTISVNKADSRSSVSVTGSPDLKVGENVRKVTVTAESGKKETYTVTIVRAAADGSLPDNKNQDEQKPENAENKTEPIKTETGGKTYIVCEDFEGIEIPETFSEAAAAYNDKQIPVIKSREGNIVLGLLKPDDSEEESEARWFFYSEKTGSFFRKHSMTVDEIFAFGQSMADEAALPASGNEVSEDASENGGFINTDNFMYIVLGGTLALLFIAVVCLQISIIRKRKD